MSKRSVLFFIAYLCFFSSIGILYPVQLTENGKKVIPDKTSTPIKINGLLDEEVWKNPPIKEKFFTYIPSYGEPMARETEVWMAYNNEFLYFAFKCYDPKPETIKTSLSPRDKITRDDWVAVVLDSVGNKQTSYEFYVNPNGIQMDALNSSVSGWDLAPDFVWHSAGKITAQGYQVEIAIPLESIRFKSGKDVQMRFLLLRNITRLGESGTWPKTEPGQTDYNFMVTAVYKDLKPRLKLELLPNFTYSRDKLRSQTGKEWAGDSDTNIGAAIKYGITSQITAEATINPDFSQVESDAFQVQVNRRYPVFYDEKRPFFMEGLGILDFGLVNDGMVTSAVHTRNIVDPSWATKVTGSAGKMSFGLLAANDQSLGQPWQNGTNPNLGKDVFWGIARGKYTLNSDNSLGLLYSGRHFAGAQNNVAGVDLQYRFFKNARLSLSYLASQTRHSQDGETLNGSGINAMLEYSTRKLRTWAAYERYDENFEMYSAFINRTNFSRGIFYVMPDFRMKIKKAPWFRNIQPYFYISKLHDYGTGMDDTFQTLGVNLYFMLRGWLILEYRNEKEAWLGELYKQKYLFAWGRLQMFNWLFIITSYRSGDKIYYGPGDPFMGSGDKFKLLLSIQPNIKFNLGVEYIKETLDHKKEKRRVYSVDILNLQGTYHFNKHFFLRGTLRYNDFQEKLLGDFLASFTLIPGTVAQLGYGSLFQRQQWQGNRWEPGIGNLVNVRNGLFFKISYLWRIK